MAKYPSWRVEGEPRWYDPILEKIEALEQDANIFEDIGEGLEDDAPDWVAMCLYNGITPLRPYMGMDNLKDGVNAKRVGSLVGCKSSFCDSFARFHNLLDKLSPKQLHEIEEAYEKAFEEGTFKDSRKVWKRFAEEFKPRSDEIRRFASELASAQSVQENIDYNMGYVKGVRMVIELGNTIRKAQKKGASKRDRDYLTRGAVLTFAVSNWKMIEENRQELTWMRLTELFDEATEHQVPVDEETFKKILQRGMLTIGKSSRPMGKGRSRTSKEPGCP